jgi:hypothetical protein
LQVLEKRSPRSSDLAKMPRRDTLDVAATG